MLGASVGKDTSNMESNIKGKDGERFVYELATNTFLNFWCYLNPVDINGDKKEICDLLIHFSDTLLIVSVKNYEFKGLYTRYFRKSIEKDVRQVNGAENKLLKRDKEIIIKSADERLHSINPHLIKYVHRVIVHLGDKVHFYPFNRETNTEKFIHVFDKNSFLNIINHLDTISDFTKYLVNREKTFSNKEVLILPSEEHEFDSATGLQFIEHSFKKETDKKSVLLSGTESDLLAVYIFNDKSFPEHITKEKYDMLYYEFDGKWDEFNQMNAVKNKQSADKISYFIDNLVKNEILKHQSNNMLELAKELMSFDRFNRRILSEHFFQFINSYKSKRGSFIARRFGELDNIGILFVFFSIDLSEEQVKTILAVALDAFIFKSDYKYDRVIMFASNNYLSPIKCGYENNIKPFDKKTEDSIKSNIKALNWYQNTTVIKFNEQEYPE